MRYHVILHLLFTFITLTITFCCRLNPTEIIVVVGTNYLTIGGFAYVVDAVKKHENYDPNNKLDDIAVLHLRNPISLTTAGVKIIPLSNYGTPGGVYGLFSGWGLTSYPSNILSNELHFITLRTINLNECTLFLQGLFPITFSHVCTLAPSGKGICTGDTGGPLVINEVQHGISIWGVPCGKGYPDVFTSVSYYRTWIKDKTNV